MRNVKRSNPGKRGFTLLEALVTVVVVVIIASSLAVVFRTLLGSWNKAEASSDALTSAQAILDQISRELRCAMEDSAGNFYLVGIDKEDAHISNTNSDELYFVSAVKDSAGDGICEVGYWVNDKADGKDDTLRRYSKEDVSGAVDFSTSVPLSTGKVFASGVKNFEISFWGPGTTDWQVNALKSWNSTTTLPVAVKIMLKITDDKKKAEQELEKVIFLPNA